MNAITGKFEGVYLLPSRGEVLFSDLAKGNLTEEMILVSLGALYIQGFEDARNGVEAPRGIDIFDRVRWHLAEPL